MTTFQAQFDRTSDLLAHVSWTYSDYEMEESRSPASVQHLFQNGRWVKAEDYLDAQYPRVYAPYQAMLYRDGVQHPPPRFIHIPYRSIEELPHTKEYCVSHVLLHTPPTQTTFVEPIMIRFSLIGNPMGDSLYGHSAIIPIRFI